MGTYKKTRKEFIEEIRLLRSRLEELSPLESVPEQAKRILPILQRAVEQSIDGIALANMEGIIQFVNPAWAQMHGYSVDDLLGKHLRVFHTEEQMINDVNPFNRQVRKKGSHQGNVGHVRKDGTTFRTWMTVTLLRDQDQEAIGLVGIARDITERQQMEDTLRAAKNDWENIFESISDPVWVMDQDYHILDANRASVTVLRRSKDKIIGRLCYELIHCSDHPAEKCPYQKVLESKHPETVDMEIHLLNGTYIITVAPILDSTGKIVKTIHIAKDISKRKQAEETLRESEEKYKSLFEFAGDALFIIDHTEEGARFLDCNDHTLKLFGCTHRDQIIGKTPEDFSPAVQPDGQPSNEKTFELARAVMEGHPQIFEWMHYRLDGTPFWVEVNLTRIEIKGKSFMQAVVREITNRKQTEEKLFEYQAQLKTLASELSLSEERERRQIAIYLHDHVNQELALAMIKLQAACGAGEPVDVGQLDEICKAIKRAIGTMRELTFDLSSPTLYKIGLEAAVAELLESHFGGSDEITYEFFDDKAAKPLSEDVRVVLFRSVRELLVNIVKHAQAGKVMVAIAKNRDCIQITVSDDGVGFDADGKKLFGRDIGGLGLFSVQERLNYIGGKFEIQSQPGKGSRFTLTAPLKTETDVT